MLYTIHNSATTSSSLETALSDLRNIVAHRIQVHFDNGSFDIHAWTREKFSETNGILKSLPISLNSDEWITLMLALAPHLKPDFYASLISEYLPSGGDFPEFGGVKGANHRGLLPTGETIQFVLAGMDIDARLKVNEIFSEDHFFYRQGILWLEPVKEGEPAMSGRIVVAQHWVDKILWDKETVPRFGMDFPAKKITTAMLWEDVVLNPGTQTEVNEITNWLEHHHLFSQDENLKRKIKPGFRVLFYGPSGTGKTLTAALLGKHFNKDVYRVDLSQVVSKYIGETEKNLESVFRRAESKDWILFFDEADALFGKRTNVQSSHDKYANQEVSYLLQRVEDYPGLMILASNFKNNLDDAFLRRFHSLVHFPMPNSSERLLLWKKSMPVSLTIDASVTLDKIAAQFELSGAGILNAVQHAVLQCYSRKEHTIRQSDLLDGVRKEYMKEDKSL